MVSLAVVDVSSLIDCSGEVQECETKFQIVCAVRNRAHCFDDCVGGLLPLTRKTLSGLAINLELTPVYTPS